MRDPARATAIGTPVVEHFVAQMLNLDVLDAVSFDKGCYPGQEVIARVHHLGSVKRRMRHYACDSAAPIAPGAAVLTADGANVGEVVRARARTGALSCSRSSNIRRPAPRC